MQAFTQHSGTVALMDRANVDTDQIIPKQFLKRIERTGFGQFLFFDWRFLDDGSENPDFELNESDVVGSTILVTRRNFGCGSSREHAVWSLEDYGYRCLIAPSFGDIFYNNCFKNGVLPIRFDEATVEDIFQRATKNEGYRLDVDLDTQMVCDQFGLALRFEIEPSRRDNLLHGFDDIALTLQWIDKISQFEAARGIISSP